MPHSLLLYAMQLYFLGSFFVLLISHPERDQNLAPPLCISTICHNVYTVMIHDKVITAMPGPLYQNKNNITQPPNDWKHACCKLPPAVRLPGHNVIN